MGVGVARLKFGEKGVGGETVNLLEGRRYFLLKNNNWVGFGLTLTYPYQAGGKLDSIFFSYGHKLIKYCFDTISIRFEIFDFHTSLITAPNHLVSPWGYSEP